MEHAGNLDDFATLSTQVTRHVADFIESQKPLLAGISADLAPLNEIVRNLLDGGKRLRPAFAYWGWRAIGGTASDSFVRAISALEFIQAGRGPHGGRHRRQADVLGGGARPRARPAVDRYRDDATRRGRPSVHEQFAALHGESGWHGSAHQFGTGAAILLGDLCLTWADEMFYGSDLATDTLSLGKPYFDVMRTEVMAGQYLDLLEQVRQTADIDAVRQVMIFKSAKYTIERPLHLGASMAGANDEQLKTLTHYAIPLGVAFQLRDDVLGVFGDPQTTGKPAGDDVREGKRTMLIARTLNAATEEQRHYIGEHLGNKELTTSQLERFREIIVETGALATVENDIHRGREKASEALAAGDFSTESKSALENLAQLATERNQ